MSAEPIQYSGNIRRIVTALLFILTVAYPFLWYFGQGHMPLTLPASIMAIAWILRSLLHTERRQKILALLPALFFIVVIIKQQTHAMYWYPVWANLMMLLIFSSSLFSQQSIIERIARLQQPDLPEQGVRYTRHVTQIWCVFFVLNGGIAAYLIVHEKFAAWALYTGMIAYILMGILLSLEWLYRKLVLKI